MKGEFAKNSPLSRAIELTLKKSSIELFSSADESFLPTAYLLCSVEAIQEAFVKKHKNFTEMVHPFREVKSFLSPTGFKALRIAGDKKPTSEDIKELEQWLRNCQENSFQKLSERDKPFDLYYELSFLSLQFALKFLFDFEGEELAKKFLDNSIEFETFLTEMRRGSLRESSDEEIADIRSEIFKKQFKIVSTILTEVGVNDINKQIVRAFTRTVLNSYVGTATSFFWMVHLLDKHPAEKAKLSAELKGLDLSSDLDMLDTPKVQAFINESLRLYPSAWMMTRKAQEDATISGRDLNSGEIVHVCIYSLHRDPRYWDKPDTFLPSRFLDVKANNIDAFLPFGLGPRRCVGSKYAEYILKLFMLNYLGSFDVDFSAAAPFFAVPQVALQPYPSPKVVLK